MYDGPCRSCSSSGPVTGIRSKALSKSLLGIIRLVLFRSIARCVAS